LTRSWKEASEKIIKLPAEDPGVFDLYLSLIFFGTVPIEEEKAVDGSLSFKEQERRANAEYLQLIKLYLLCDRLQD
jgi:hypothetical protein